MANLPVPVRISEADYEAIESAVMETARGRWFLAEYARRNRTADTTMLLKAIERIESAMQGQRSVDTVDRIRFDLVEMSKAIARTKAEIAAMKPDADDHGKFGEASEELDSVVQATEAATSDILACAESIQEMAWTLREQGLDPVVCDLLDAKATEVYTACSFQDITGQRTQKVIGVLRYLESRINAMIGIWGLDGAMAAEAAEARATNGDDALLNGPAKPGHGLDQADVDMVMGPAAVAEWDSGIATPAQASDTPPGFDPAPVVDEISLEKASAEDLVVASAKHVAVTPSEPAADRTLEAPAGDFATEEVTPLSVAPIDGVGTVVLADEETLVEEETALSQYRAVSPIEEPVEGVVDEEPTVGVEAIAMNPEAPATNGYDENDLVVIDAPPSVADEPSARSRTPSRADALAPLMAMSAEEKIALFS